MLPLDKRTQILHMLCEGSSMRSISRIVDVSINTVSKLLVDAGTACSIYQSNVFKNLPCKRIQVDEIWSFCSMKEKNVPDDKKDTFGIGDVWTWTAICADTKIIPAWLVGNRDAESAQEFINDLASRFDSKIQLTSDGFSPYREAVESSFGLDVDFAQLVKMYGTRADGQARGYLGSTKNIVVGHPDVNHISTSFVERQNLNMRMGMKRFTRKTNAFSKKVENHAHMVALYFMYYNFCRIHKSLRVTPAMEAGVTAHLWGLDEVINLIN